MTLFVVAPFAILFLGTLSIALHCYHSYDWTKNPANTPTRDALGVGVFLGFLLVVELVIIWNLIVHV